MALKNMIQFVQEVRFELSKVEWPKRNEFIGSTIIVLFLVFLFSVYLGLIDLGLSRLAKNIFTLYGESY